MKYNRTRATTKKTHTERDCFVVFKCLMFWALCLCILSHHCENNPPGKLYLAFSHKCIWNLLWKMLIFPLITISHPNWTLFDVYFMFTKYFNIDMDFIYDVQVDFYIRSWMIHSLDFFLFHFRFWCVSFFVEMINIPSAAYQVASIRVMI